MTGGAPLQWVGPMPPLRTGIAGYCDDFLRAVDGLWDVELFLEAGSKDPEYATVHQASEKFPDADRPVVIQLGNSEHHEQAFRAALDVEGIVVLHDVVLHHELLSRHVRTGTSAEYWRELESRYGPEGVAVGRAVLSGRQVEDLQRYPLSERFIEHARLVVVHSEYAARQVERHVPGTQVQRVPMGIPLPITVERGAARCFLGIPDSQFLVVSITHVNPHKRIPIVLRAIRRLASRLPETRLILAGSGTDWPDMQREVRLLGLEGIVTCLGWVDDATARMLAASADACVNLRYPSTGETSASLLRLLGAGRPVLVTDDGAATELPPGVAFRVAPDSMEVDIIEETLFELAGSDQLRDDVGRAAREWVSEAHSMGAAVDGYRSAIASAYGIELPPLAEPIVHESLELDRPRASAARPEWQSVASAMVGDALGELGLASDLPIVETAAHAINELGLHRIRPEAAGAGPSERLIERLACPKCRGALELGEEQLVCRLCGHVVPVVRGVPEMSGGLDLDHMFG